MEKDTRDDLDDTYELDLDQASDNNVDEIMRDALDAVERADRSDDDAPAEEPVTAVEDEAPVAAELSPEDANLREQLLRTLADFDNFRKRTEREKAEVKRFAAQNVWKDVLGVIDNLERATTASGGVDELKQGLDMVLRQLADVMKRYGVVAVPALGEAFDPQVHEAVAKEESAEVEGPTVTAELQKGYTIHDRLLRPAMVYVAMPAQRPVAATEDNAETEAN
ncbi:MAG: nucleotide exchange factor GrpE [Acidobacteriota bacterium]